MIDWLRRAKLKAPAAPPTRETVAIAGRTLPLTIRKLANARQMTLRLSPDRSEIRVSLPRWGRVAEARAFVADRSAWIAAQLADAPSRFAYAEGCQIPFRGSPLTVAWRQSARRAPALDGDTLSFGGPQDGIPVRLKRWLEQQALTLLAADLADYCARAGIANPPELRLSRARRRWGSCASDGTIRINWRLVMAPDAVRRSVVAHEVAHLLHFDHSPAFHAALADLFEGDLAQANRWLRREGPGLHAPFG